MEVIYSSDFGDISIDYYDRIESQKRTAQRLMHYAILLSQIYGKKNMPKDHTTSTKGIDLHELMNASPEFQKIMGSGLYAAVGDHICLYSPDIIKSGKDSNTVELNEKVLKSPEECCLTMAADSIEEVKETKDYSKISFYHPEKAEILQQSGVIREDFNISLRDLLPRSYDESEGLDASMMDNNPLEYFIKDQARRCDISLKRLADEIKVSERTIERFWTKPKARPALNNVIAVCIGLKMPPPTSDFIIELAGYKLRNIPLERGYLTLIHTFYNKGIAFCNQFMRENHLEALTAAT